MPVNNKGPVAEIPRGFVSTRSFRRCQSASVLPDQSQDALSESGLM